MMAPSDTSFSLLKELGLTDNEIKIYEAILGNGLVTIGEISVLTGLDLDVVNTSLSDLLAIRLVKSVKGGLTRYYATLPFLSEMLIGQKDMILSLQGIIEQVKNIHEHFISSKKNISGVLVPKTAEEFAETLKSNLIEPVITVSEGAREAIDSFLTNIENLLEKEIINEFSQLKNDLHKALDLPTHLSQSFAHLQAQGSTIIEQLLRTRNAKVFSILKKVNSEIKTSIDQYRKEMEQTINDTVDAIHQMQTISAQEINKFGEKLEAFTNNIESTLLKGKETMQLIENELKSFEKIDSIIEKHISTYNHETEQKIQGIKKNLKEVLDKLEAFEGVKELSSIRTTIEMTYSEFLGFKLDSEPLKEQIKTETHNVMSNIANSLEESLKIYLDAISDLDVENIKLSIIKQLDLLNETEQKTIQLLEKYKQKMLEENKKLLETQVEALNQISIEEKEVTEQYVKKIEEEVEKLNNEYKQRANNLKENAERIVDTTIGKTTDYLLKQHQEILGKHIELSSIFNSVISTSEQVLEASIENTKEAMIKPLDKITAEIGRISQELTNKITESIHVFLTLFNGKYGELRRIADEANRYEFNQEINTWGIINEDAAYAVLLDLVMRSKRQCTIVLPELKLDIIDRIERKRMTRIELVTDLDIEHDRRLITKIKQKGNISLRSYKKQDFLACIRDEEEAIVCSYDKNGRVNGIKTIDPDLVQILKLIIKDKIIRDSKSI